MNIWPGAALLLGILAIGAAFVIYALWSAAALIGRFDKFPGDFTGAIKSQCFWISKAVHLTDFLNRLVSAHFLGTIQRFRFSVSAQVSLDRPFSPRLAIPDPSRTSSSRSHHYCKEKGENRDEECPKYKCECEGEDPLLPQSEQRGAPLPGLQSATRPSPSPPSKAGSGSRSGSGKRGGEGRERP